MTAQSTKNKQLEEIYQQLKADFAERHQDLLSWMQAHDLSFADIKLFSQQVLAATSLAGSVVLNNPQEMKAIDQVQALEKSKDDLLAQVTQEEYEIILEKITRGS